MTIEYAIRTQFRGSVSGRKLLFLHGFMGIGEDWMDVADYLDDSFHCIIPDIPPFGGSKVPRGPLDLYSMPAIARSVLQVLAAYPDQGADLVGYSMGGRLALYTVIQYPNRFKRIVLESASPGLRRARDREMRKAADERLADRIESGRFENFIRDWYMQPLFETICSDVERFEQLIDRRMAGAKPAEFAKSLRFMGTGAQPSMWDRLKEISQPVLLIVGEKDDKFRAIADRMAEYIRNVEVAVVAGAGHNVHLEKPDEFAKLITRFCKDT